MKSFLEETGIIYGLKALYYGFIALALALVQVIVPVGVILILLILTGVI